jgi:hypothetical protein
MLVFRTSRFVLEMRSDQHQLREKRPLGLPSLGSPAPPFPSTACTVRKHSPWRRCFKSLPGLKDRVESKPVTDRSDIPASSGVCYSPHGNSSFREAAVVFEPAKTGAYRSGAALQEDRKPYTCFCNETLLHGPRSSQASQSTVWVLR